MKLNRGLIMKKSYFELPIIFCLGFIFYLSTTPLNNLTTALVQGVIISLTIALVFVGIKEVIKSIVHRFSY